MTEVVTVDVTDRFALHELVHLYGSVVYDDVAVRTPDGWRLASRRVTLRRPGSGE